MMHIFYVVSIKMLTPYILPYTILKRRTPTSRILEEGKDKSNFTFSETITKNISSIMLNGRRKNMFKKMLLAAAVLLLFVIVIVYVNTSKTQEKIKGWEQSPLFTAGIYKMIGEEGRIGFIYDDTKTEPTRFYPNKPNKYMWHFWGKEDELNGTLKVVATHQNDGKQVILMKDVTLAGPNNGADRHIPSSMSLPESGMWKLDAYIGDKLFGTIYVKVYDE